MKIKKLIISLILAFILLSDLPAEIWQALEIQQTIDALIEPNYAAPISVEPSDRLSFYDGEYVSVRMEDDRTMRVSGVTDKKYLLLQLSDIGSGELARANVKPKGGEFSYKLHIPSSDAETAELVIFSNDEYYGEYVSWVSRYIYLKQQDGVWSVFSPPEFEHNKDMFQSAKSLTRALNPTRNVQSHDADIAALAERVTSGLDSDYGKALAIHDYICQNFAYDKLLQGTTDNYDAHAALAENRAICSGFSNAYAALCRAAGVPCLVVSGFASEQGENPLVVPNENIDTNKVCHAWNEVYADGRWIIVDTTWDCGNSFVDGKSVKTHELSHAFFDANIEFFSVNHKILTYKDI